MAKEETNESKWTDNAEQGIQSLKEIEESLADFTEAFKERAGEYRSAMSAIDGKIAKMDTVLKEGCKTLDDKVNAVAESVHVFDQAKEVAIQWQEKALAAKEDLEKAMSLATSNFDGIAESLMSLKEAYGAALKIKQDVLPEIKKAVEEMKTVASQGVVPSVIGTPSVDSAQLTEIKNEVGELRQVVDSLVTMFRNGEAQTKPASIEANRELAEKFGDSCKALLELVSEKYGVSGK